MQIEDPGSSSRTALPSYTSNHTQLNNITTSPSDLSINGHTQINNFSTTMEVKNQESRPIQVLHDNGSMVSLRGKDEKQNQVSTALTPESTSFVTIASPVIQTDSTAPIAAGSITNVIQAPGQETTTVVIPPNLPEGCSLLIGEDNSQYVTVPQDGQTYAIPIAEFQAMQQGRTLTFQGMDSQTIIMQAPSTLVQNPTTGVETQSPQLITETTSEASGTQELTPNVTESQAGKLNSPANSHTTIKWGMAGGQQDHLRPSFTKSVVPTSNATTPDRQFKPIKVDNWGIFLLSRLQSYFQKKEFCDLTIRFPSRNAQIKVHRLMVNACTDYFLQLEQEGNVNPNEPGVIDMPSNFTPETVAPIIKFMYTGRLEFKPGSFQKLRETASDLQMFVLTKLMDAQLNSPITTQDDAALMKGGNRRKRKRNAGSSISEDPVKQMKKIKKIEKKFTDQERKNKVLATKLNAIKTEPGTLPGKKLPIWKKREFTVASGDYSTSQISKGLNTDQLTSINSSEVSVTATVDEQKTYEHDEADTNITIGRDQAMISTQIDKSNDNTPGTSNLVTLNKEAKSKTLSPKHSSIMEESVHVTHSISSPTKAYGSIKQKLGEKPKGIPRKIREINEDLNFEKIRRTGTRKLITSSTSEKEDIKSSTEQNKEANEEDMKEFLHEQKKRIVHTGEYDDEEDDDYYDNDAELGYDDYNEGEEHANIDEPILRSPPAKPILKSPLENLSPVAQSVPRKSVRFSLRPGSVPVPKGIDSNDFTPSVHSPSNTNASTTNSTNQNSPNSSPTRIDRSKRITRGNIENSTSTKQNSKENKDDLDETVDEFTRAVEEEQQLEEGNGEGQEFNASTQNSPAFKKDSSGEKASRQAENKSLSNSYKEYKKDVRKFHNMQARSENNSTVTSKVDPKTDMVSEILRKFPNILKENKQVKIKVMAKDSEGKSKMQIITLKSQGATNSAALAVTAARNASKSEADTHKSTPSDANDKTQSALITNPSGQIALTSVNKPETVETPVAGNLLTGALGLRAIPKVKYTGKRGRPKKVQPGEVDPHADIRKEIEERLQKAAGIGQTLVIESTGFDNLENQDHLIRKTGQQNITVDENAISQPLNDPSSEAEALSNVASGIATSLGLAANVSNEQTPNEQNMQNAPNEVVNVGAQANSGPLADLEHYEGGQSQLSNSGIDNYQVISNRSTENNLVSQSNESSAITNKHIRKGSGGQSNKNNQSKDKIKGSKVKEMEMDWEDEEEEILQA